MQRVSLKKIKSVLKALDVRFIRIAVVFLLLVVLAATWGHYNSTSSITNTRTLRTDTAQFRLEIVSTPEAQQKGLGGRPGLEPNEGMIFTYPDVNERCFWMKDMNFPIDIIWVNSWHVVTDVRSNVSPNTYPKTYCAQAAYVIELKAGAAAQNGITLGRQLDF